ncbi:uncharacterized protein LOC128206274 isoform X3 [Mya arenaria]|uniref:uncharacterized protein LOC128206274 isoform X3 n=1 Tax=Mya arenaria TaxID=6604 RepID=UPI0022E25578|nr:uncharacterized protein LOC128206274 isoform X3 [Mya arenaria]
MLLLCSSVLMLVLSVSGQCFDSGENAVEMKFYRASASTFESENSPEAVIKHVISEATSYCSQVSNSYCDLDACCSDPFKDEHVIEVSGYPQDEVKDMLYKIFLLNRNSSEPSCAVRKQYLQDILENAREEIHDETGYWITYIDDEFFGIPPSTKLNQIIIPIAFGVVLILIIVTIILYQLAKKREADERRQRILTQRKKKSDKKTNEPYVTEKGTVKPGHELETPRNGTINANEMKESLYKGGPRKGKSDSNVSDDSAIRMDTVESTRQRQGYAFESEPNGATGYDRRLKPIDSDHAVDGVEKKKKKKKKRSKSKDAERNEGTDEQSEDSDIQANGLTKTSVWGYDLQ